MMKNTQKRKRLPSRLLAMLLVMVLCIGSLPWIGTPATVLAADSDTSVTLDLANGAISIDYNRYTQDDTTVEFSGDYVITGSITTDTPLDITNSSEEAVTYNITLDNARLIGEYHTTAVRVDSGNEGDITLNLSSKGISKISADTFTAIHNFSEKNLTVNLSVLYGSLTMENRSDNIEDCLITLGGNNDLIVVPCTEISVDESGCKTFVTKHTWVDNGDGTHSFEGCSYCGADKVSNEAHIYCSGDSSPHVCSVCGTTGYWIRLLDDDSDGWEGASLSVYVNGVETVLTMDEGTYLDFLIECTEDDAVALVFDKGNDDGESGLEVYDIGNCYGLFYSCYDLNDLTDGEVIYSRNIADYSSIKAAIASIPDDLNVYTKESIEYLFAAINAVTYYLPASMQEAVDEYAKNILNAIDSLVLRGEDEGEETLSLTLSDENSRLIITSTGYRWGEDGEETSYTGTYSLTTGGINIEASVLVESGIQFITLEEVSLYSSGDYSPFAISSGSAAFLTLEGGNTLYADSFYGDYAGLNVKRGAYLYVSGEGSLEASGGPWAAGIGGGQGESSGKITICGGTIIASSAGQGAGIGGGAGGSSENITICGGTVTAISANRGAGIGGGLGKDGGIIEITGGYITVSSNDSLGAAGSGIGGGDGGNAGEIILTGGTIVIEGYDDNIIGANKDIDEDSTNYVIIDGAFIFLSDTLDTDGYDAIQPAPKNLNGEVVYHCSYGSERDDGYAKAILSDGSELLVYVLNGQISLYLPDGITIASDADPYADYTAINNAIESFSDLTIYTEESAKDLEDAIDAVVYGLYFDRQDEVDAMAEAIEEAVAALVYRDADYSAVEEAIAAVPTDLAVYTEESVTALQSAINAVVEGKNITEQDEVDAMAEAIVEATEALVYLDADYSAVEEALAAVPMDLNLYTEESVSALQEAIEAVVEGKNIMEQDEVDAMAEAIDAVVEGKNITEQAAVDAMAETIEAAVAALVYKDADYSAVEEALASVPADLTLYTDETVSALQEAIEAVVEGKDITEQDEVDAMAEEIAKAIAALVYRDADYSAVGEALASVPTDLTIYTDETVQVLQEAIEAVVEGKDITEQAAVDAMAEAIEVAVAALVYKGADYSAVEEALASVPTDLTLYTDETVSALQEAIEAVVEGKDITEQDEVDAMAKAIVEATEALVYLDADYNAVEEALAAVPTDLTPYTEESVSALQEAIAAVVEGKDISEQAEVDAMAEAIEAAVAALVYKDADYSAVEEALASVPTDLTLYTDENVSTLQEAIEAVVEGKNITEQDEVDAMAEAIRTAVAALVYKGADYSAVEEALASVPTDLTLYTDETVSALQEAIEAVVEGKDITEQDEVDAMAEAIRTAVAALVYQEVTEKITEEVTKEVTEEVTEEITEKVTVSLKTGDTDIWILMLALMTLSGTVILGCGIYDRRKYQN